MKKHLLFLCLVLLMCVSSGVGSHSTLAAETRPLNVAGRWTSNLGDVLFRQSPAAGNAVTGELRFANGAVATIAGTIRGDTLTFRWSIGPDVHGDGALRASEGGNRLSGSYTDRSQGSTGLFDLRRVAGSPAPKLADGVMFRDSGIIRKVEPAIKKQAVRRPLLRPPAGRTDLAAIDVVMVRDSSHFARWKASGIIRNVGTAPNYLGGRAVLTAHFEPRGAARPRSKVVFDVPLPSMAPGREYRPYGTLWAEEAREVDRLELRLIPPYFGADTNPANDMFTRDYPPPARLAVSIRWDSERDYYAIIRNEGPGISLKGHLARMSVRHGTVLNETLVTQLLPSLEPHQRIRVDPDFLPERTPEWISVKIIPGNDQCRAILPSHTVLPRPRF